MNRPARDLGDQVGGPGGSQRLEVGVDAALEARAGVGHELVPLRRLSNRDWVEEGDLQAARRSVPPDAVVQAAHHASQTYRLAAGVPFARCGDDEALGRQLDALLVEDNEGLALASAPHLDSAPRKGA